MKKNNYSNDSYSIDDGHKSWFMDESVANPDSKIANKVDALQGVRK